MESWKIIHALLQLKFILLFHISKRSPEEKWIKVSHSIIPFHKHTAINTILFHLMLVKRICSQRMALSDSCYKFWEKSALNKNLLFKSLLWGKENIWVASCLLTCSNIEGHISNSYNEGDAALTVFKVLLKSWWFTIIPCFTSCKIQNKEKNELPKRKRKE